MQSRLLASRSDIIVPNIGRDIINGVLITYSTSSRHDAVTLRSQGYRNKQSSNFFRISTCTIEAQGSDRTRSDIPQVRSIKDPVSDRIKDFSTRSGRNTEILGSDLGSIC